MYDNEIAVLADSLEAASLEAPPRSIDAMKTTFVVEMSSTHPCCPLTKTTVDCATTMYCVPPKPSPGTIRSCNLNV